jgi:hypothetical protein
MPLQSDMGLFQIGTGFCTAAVESELSPERCVVSVDLDARIAKSSLRNFS